MKVGIVTFHHALNYGAVLQAYALQQYLNSLGIDSDVIDYRSPYMEYFYKPIKANPIRDAKMFARELLYYRCNKKKRERFDSFLKSHIKLSKVVKNQQELKQMNSEYDFFIAGSDQVWNLKWSGFDKTYFLNFADKHKKYSYAASFGFEKIPDGQEQEYRELLSQFQTISVRENTGKEIVKDLLNREAEVSVDPTCLIDKEKWENICVYPDEQGYVLVYLLDKSEELVSFAKKIASERKTKIIYISDALRKEYDFDYRGFLSPTEFIGLFAYAGYVVTNSFHGLMFSVIFEKEFCIQYQKKEGAPNSRLIDFIQDYQLENRLLENIKIEEEKPNYILVKKIMRKKVEQSRSFILNLPIQKNKNRIQLFDKKEECCGCRACEQICPVSAIEMQPDEEGFLYPVINHDMCVQCKKCISVCPLQRKVKMDGLGKHQVKTAVAYQKDEVKRMRSRSGGVFAAVSDVILDEQGVVYGVGFNNDLTVSHMRAITTEKRNSFCGSKYVQSDTVSTFSNVFEDLQSGKKVLFSGTACQIAGLYAYLAKRGGFKECNNLITMDIVCHGVVSPLIWKENLKEISEKLGAKPINVNFRDKSFGWSTHIESYSCGNKLVTSGRYTAIFYENVFLRPCCYDCQYASVVRVSDITLADAWGIHRVSPDWDIEKGVSLVLLNTDMGREYFDRAKKDLVTKDVSIEEFMQPNLQHPSVRPKEREKAIRLYKNQGYIALADWCEKKYNYMVKKNKIKSEIVKIMRRLHLK